MGYAIVDIWNSRLEQEKLIKCAKKNLTTAPKKDSSHWDLNSSKKHPKACVQGFFNKNWRSQRRDMPWTLAVHANDVNHNIQLLLFVNGLPVEIGLDPSFNPLRCTVHGHHMS